MQKRVAPAAFAARASASTASIFISFSAFTPVLYCAALRAIGAVLRAASGLDRQQRRHLDLVRIEMKAMNALRLEHQLGKRQGKQRPHLLPRPIIADLAQCGVGNGQRLR